jgi:hypothetical protein
MMRRILTTNMNMKTAYMKMVSRNLDEDQNLIRKQISFEFLEKIKDADFFKFVVTYNQTWLFQYDPETQLQSMQWEKSISETKESWNVKIKK